MVNRKHGFHDVFMISLVCNADGDRRMSDRSCRSCAFTIEWTIPIKAEKLKFVTGARSFSVISIERYDE